MCVDFESIKKSEHEVKKNTSGSPRDKVKKGGGIHRRTTIFIISKTKSQANAQGWPERAAALNKILDIFLSVLLLLRIVG